MATMVVAAINQQAAHAHLAHLAEGDYLRVSHGELLRFRSVGKHCFTRCYRFFALRITLFLSARDRCSSGPHQCFSVYRWTSVPKKNPRQEENED